MISFDENFSVGLKPPPRKPFCWMFLSRGYLGLRHKMSLHYSRMGQILTCSRGEVFDHFPLLGTSVKERNGEDLFHFRCVVPLQSTTHLHSSVFVNKVVYSTIPRRMLWPNAMVATQHCSHCGGSQWCGKTDI